MPVLYRRAFRPATDKSARHQEVGAQGGPLGKEIVRKL